MTDRRDRSDKSDGRAGRKIARLRDCEMARENQWSVISGQWSVVERAAAL